MKINQELLVKLDKTLDFVPFVSSVTNFIDLFIKHAILPFVNEKRIQESRYFKYIKNKDTMRSSILLIPIFGNTYHVTLFIIERDVRNLGDHAYIVATIGKDEKAKLEIYKKGADQHFPKCLSNLGHLYAKGKGVDKNPEQAKKYLEEAIELGSVQAKFYLAKILLNEQKYSEIIELLHEFNNKTSLFYPLIYPKAMEMLAFCYLETNMEDKAVKILQKVDNTLSCSEPAAILLKLADKYHEGKTLISSYALPKNDKKALKLYFQVEKLCRKASQKKINAEVLYKLGHFVENGYGIKSNLDQARELYKLAEEFGYQEKCDR